MVSISGHFIHPSSKTGAESIRKVSESDTQLLATTGRRWTLAGRSWQWQTLETIPSHLLSIQLARWCLRHQRCLLPCRHWPGHAHTTHGEGNIHLSTQTWKHNYKPHYAQTGQIITLAGSRGQLCDSHLKTSSTAGGLNEKFQFTLPGNNTFKITVWRLEKKTKKGIKPMSKLLRRLPQTLQNLN